MDTTAKVLEARGAFERGDFGAAASAYRELLAGGTEHHVEAYHFLSIIAHRSGKPDLALQLEEAALALRPDFLEAIVNKAVFLRVLGRGDEARAAAKQALGMDTQSASAWHTVGFFALEDHDYAEALRYSEEAVRLEPGHILARVTYASALMMAGRYAEAYDNALIALRAAPGEALMQLTMGQIIRGAGYPLRAIPYLQKAFEQRPGYTDAKMAEAAARFQTDDWEKSWEVWECRPYDVERFKSLPRWDGKKTGHLILHAEQGMGDAFQFLRFVSLVAPLAARLTLQVPKPLAAIVAGTFPDLLILFPSDPVPPADAHGPIMSLPYVLKNAEKDLPAPVSLSVPSEMRQAARAFLDRMGRPRIGFVWAGNPKHLNDINRSMSFEKAKPFIRTFAPHLLSVQDGQFCRFSAEGDKQERLSFTDGDPMLATAALLSEMDLLVSVDSMPAHLAGSLGRPVWLLLGYDADGRWMYEREDTPWYESLRLFRQKKPQDWDGLLAEVSAELRRFLAGDLSVLPPKRWMGPVPQQHPQAVPLPFE